LQQIPRILHYCFGMGTGAPPWSLVHYVCLRSAIAHIRPREVRFYYHYEPQGPWWDLAKPLITLHRIEPPTEIFGNPVIHPAHRADIVRLEALLESGGIYLDLDVLVRRDFEELLSNDCVLGEQGAGGKEGLCNAVIIARPQAMFLQRWHAEFRHFRSRGRDAYWDELSVKVPGRLARSHPSELTILDHRAFFWPLWRQSQLKELFASAAPMPGPVPYAHHLWESHSWTPYLAGLSVRRVRRVDTNFHRLIRRYLEELPDDFAQPSLLSRTKVAVGRVRHRIGHEFRWQRQKLNHLRTRRPGMGSRGE